LVSSIWFLVLLVPALLLLAQLQSALGRVRGTFAGLSLVLLLGACWLLLDNAGGRQHATAIADPISSNDRRESATSESCFKCHEEHYASWHRTYHRTMTREATPENVKGDFNDATFMYQGVASRLTREGDTFYMETLDQAGGARAGAAQSLSKLPLRRYKVDRLVGSHWFQECMFKDDRGRYWRLPLSYHIVEKRWIHTNGAFLAPDTDDFWSKSTVWNESCVFCHNTKPVKGPLTQPWGARRWIGYQTEVAELGIACEACHGPGQEHIRVNQNPARRYAIQRAGAGDPTIVNPRRLSVARADDICGHCHGALAPKAETWDAVTVADPFNAGEDLRRFNDFFWSEAEQAVYYERKRPDPNKPLKPEPLDGRFWGDGTPLTTALEYNGMALSACYQTGHGKLSCRSCHSMHDSDPNFLVARGMETNEACYQCHAEYRQKLAAHTHHTEGSAGSLCYNCHMPYQVYSLLTTHRSHRIERLRIKDSLGTGKPHACNLCHLDKSLGWTQDRLVEWYGKTPEALPAEERKYASALLHLCRSDARTRVVVAGAFSWPAAQAASGTDWAGPVLARLLEHERFPAVRYLAHRGLRSMYGSDVVDYDYLARPTERSSQIKRMRQRLERRCQPVASNYPYLPLDEAGRSADTILELLLQKRNDPDVSVHE
jgi:predicted CXXCH cytochrome family protein